jgi:dolichyl-phosphate-mannose-protein mannosyltransferase
VETPTRIRLPVDSPFVIASLLAAVKLLLHLATNQQYGFHRDELYFIVSGSRLAAGYVDQGPLVPALAALARAVGGDSLAALRFLPAVAGALTVFSTCWLAAVLGGGRFSQVAAGLAVLIAPAYLRMHTMLHIPTFESMFWALGCVVVALILRRREPRLFLLVGLIAGVGLLNKPTMLLFGAGLIVGLAITRQARSFFRSPDLWAGGGVALLVASPLLLWQVTNGWPSLGFLAQLDSTTLGRIPWWAFALGQIVYLHPLTLPLWLGGLVFLFRGAAMRTYRPLAWIWLVPFSMLLITGGKIYYLAAAYPPLLAAGGVWAEQRLTGAASRRVAVATLIMGGLALLPAGLPLLPLDRYPGFLRAFTGGESRAEELHEVINDFYDMTGWEELAATVKVVYSNLESPSSFPRPSTGIFTVNYGEASALRVFAPDLPPARSGDMTYHLWGPGEVDPELEILVGFEPEQAAALCAETTLAARFEHPHDGAPEDHVPIVVCRPRRPLREVWPSLRHGF